MIAFLNERSLEEYGEWAASLTLFLRAAQELAGVRAVLFRDSRFFARPEFAQRFNALALQKDVRGLIRDLVFGNRYYRCWRPERVSNDTEAYSCLDPALELCDETVSEAAERQLENAQALVSVLSAADSAFSHLQLVTVTKASSGESVQVRNLPSVEQVKQWIASQRGQYDRSSRSAPRDFQTILEKAPYRFRMTGRVERRFSRRIFEEIASGRLYYVDEAHPGHSAHLEVFAATCEHLGTADIETGTLNIEARVNGRTLKL